MDIIEQNFLIVITLVFCSCTIIKKKKNTIIRTQINAGEGVRELREKQNLPAVMSTYCFCFCIMVSLMNINV